MVDHTCKFRYPGDRVWRITIWNLPGQKQEILSEKQTEKKAKRLKW
jgi:hypothetical protein